MCTQQAHIAGAAALLESAGVADPLAIKAILINTADLQLPYYDTDWTSWGGFGYT
jgi:hypothetical protein